MGTVKNDKEMFGNALLALTALIWGFSFVAQSKGLQHIGPFSFQFCRSVLGVLTLTPIFLLRRRRAEQSGSAESGRHNRRLTWLGGIACGASFTVATIFQQYALRTADAGKAAFLTAMYLIIVPVMGIFLGQRLTRRLWFCVFLCLGGVYMLSVSGHSRIDPADILLVLCAVMFAVQIQLIDYFVKQADGIELSFIQLATSCVLTALPALLMERPQWSEVLAAGLALLYAGILTCGLAYTLQIVGQRYAAPATASLIMSLESVFAMIGGILILHQIPTAREWCGCALVFAAVLLSQTGRHTDQP